MFYLYKTFAACFLAIHALGKIPTLIENHGALPRTIEELIKTDVPVPRNPVLAKLFRIAKFC